MKRRVKRGRNVHKKTDYKNKAVAFILIICISVAAGYLTATYLIGPVLGLETETVSFDFLKKETRDGKKRKESKDIDKKVIQDQLKVEEKKGYALQYGSYSNKSGANECVNELKKSGIKADIIEKDGSYKVIGEVFATREEADASKEKSAVEEDVFITGIP